MRKILLISSVLIFSLLCFRAVGQESQISEIQEWLVDNGEWKTEDVSNLIVTHSYKSNHNGATHVYASQSYNGVRIANTYLTATFNKDGELIHVAPRLIRDISAKVSGSQNISLLQAIESQLLETIPELEVIQSLEKDGFGKQKLTLTGSNYSHDARAELVYYANAEEDVALAWTFDAELPSQEHWYFYAVDASNGELIEKIDWTVTCNAPHLHTAHSCKAPSSVNQVSNSKAMTTADGSSYRVFEFPIESPIHGERTLAVEPALESASPFGWHDTDGIPGAEYTTTRGNNVNAYEDINDMNSGISPEGGEGLTFDYEYNPNELPENYTDAAIANLFYANNRIHDILVGYGFDEASGNFQATNYQNEGEDDDFVRAEAQDGGGINNANFATPPDGQRPRMQMYLWDTGGNAADLFTVNSPDVIAGSYTSSNFSEFGPGIEPGGITADLAIMVDADGSNNGCNAAVNDAELDGKIAITYRGTCNFTDKVFNAQEAGAVACIVINNQGGVIDMGGFNGNINIPSIMISQNDGALIADQIDLGETVNATLIGNDGANFNDGSFDNGIVIHEYGHGISNRLTGGPNVSGCLSNEEQMGEGWSDYYAIILTMDMESSNPVFRPMATFANGEGIEGNGIRPVPYDTSFAVNAYTYADVSNQNLSVPHGVGFVWSTMLWDLTWALIDEYGYDDDIINGTGGNNISIQLVTDALKLQACQPGFTDGRDAILAADELNYDGANKCLIWEVFAKRGLGFSADQGSTQSRADGVAAFDLPPLCQPVFNAPNAAFSVNANQTCSGVVQFTDESTDVPQSWLWDFGDGNTSEEIDPVHQYAEPGTYTVSLTVTNTLGEDTETITDIIEFGFPESPIAEDVSGCEGEMVTLSGTASLGVVQWTDADGEVVGEGDEVEVELGATTSSYFATAVQSEFEPAFAGPPNVNFGTGGNHGTEFIGTVDFETFQPLVIESALVVSGATGPRTISLYDGAAATGGIVQQVTVDIDFIGEGTIDLGFEIDLPGVYSIGLNQANLYRNDAGANYPYTIDDVFSIIGSSAGPEFYYYFYNLEITSPDCSSEPTEVVAEVTGSAIFSAEVNDLEVNFTDQSQGATSWSWDFGDGNTSDEQNPTHTYGALGTYDVTLTTDDCSYTMVVEVGVSSVDDQNNEGFVMMPNPTSDLFRIIDESQRGDLENLRIYDLRGRLVKSQSVNRENEIAVDVSSLKSGTYFVTITNSKQTPVFRDRLVVVH